MGKKYPVIKCGESQIIVMGHNGSIERFSHCESLLTQLTKEINNLLNVGVYQVACKRRNWSPEVINALAAKLLHKGIFS